MRGCERTDSHAAHDGKIAALFPPNEIDIRRIVTRLPLSMKLLSMSLALLGGLMSLLGEEIAAKWDVEISGPITDGTPSAPAPKLEPIDFKVMSSRTKRMDVTEAPEMPDLPPITGTINVTVQIVEDPNLPDPPAPLPALPPDDPAVVARLAELTEKYRGTELVFLSATVYDHNRTLLRIYPNGRVGDSVTAWSNLDFNHFCGFSIYRVKDAQDGKLHDFGLLMGIGGIDTRRWKEIAEARGIEYKGPEIPEIPKMTDLVAGVPSFVVVEGDVESPAMDTLEQIHDLYRKEGARMVAAYHARVKAHAERKAYLLANPPKPEDIVIKFWERDPSQSN
jgi:hypothetical protein